MTQQNLTLEIRTSAMTEVKLSSSYMVLLCDTAAYCLQKSSGQVPIGMISVSDSRRLDRKFSIDWDEILPIDMPDAEAAYADKKEVVEYGAYAVTLAYLSAVRGIHAVARTASTGVGFDFYLNTRLAPGPIIAGPIDRLEVSGIFSNPQRLLGRLRAKLKQALKLTIPGTARAAVVEFSEPRLAIYFRTIK